MRNKYTLHFLLHWWICTSSVPHLNFLWPESHSPAATPRADRLSDTLVWRRLQSAHLNSANILRLTVKYDHENLYRLNLWKTWDTIPLELTCNIMVDVLSEVVFITVQVLLFYYYIFISLFGIILLVLWQWFYIINFRISPHSNFPLHYYKRKRYKKNPFMVSNHLQTP